MLTLTGCIILKMYKSVLDRKPFHELLSILSSLVKFQEKSKIKMFKAALFKVYGRQ